MIARIVLGSIVMLCVLALPLHADGKVVVQKYFNDAAQKVRATDDPSEKRVILGQSLQTMSRVLEAAKASPSVSAADIISLDRLNATIRDKQDELAGRNGYAGVSDQKLNAFSDYVVQDMEQADTVVTVSLVTLLLIGILLILLVK